MKRTFLFAFYDPQGVIGETALFYLKALQPLGQVVVACDCELAPGEASKLDGVATLVCSSHHGEYDFGSYKRAFAAADLDATEVLYLVNDSVLGPLFPLLPYLEKMEAMEVPAFGLALHPSRHGAHLQSWFLGLKPEVFRAPWFASFLNGVVALGDKNAVCEQYETGFTRLLEQKGIPYAALYSMPGKKIYNSVWGLYKQGFPFVKKTVFARHGGSLAGELKRLLSAASPAFSQAVMHEGDRLLGCGYMQSFLTGNPFKLTGRYLRYLLGKLSK